jgi:ADP-ribosylglycohydrolase/sugar/nucleoside kinase (ribokinase family)
MTLLVAGNAAVLDLVLQTHARPGSAEVGTLSASPGAVGRWLPGGAAFTVALAARRQGLPVAVWHPLPADPAAEGIILALRSAGIDLSRAPRMDVAAGRCVLVQTGEGRLAWSSANPRIEPQDFNAILDGVTHVAVASRWEAWTDALLAAAVKKDVPISLIGEASQNALAYRWAHVVLDQEQLANTGPIQADIIVTTHGADGATIHAQGKATLTPASPVSVVDTTGAGDVFGGTFIARSILGDDSANAARIAALAAARACEGWGAWAGLVGAAEPAPNVTREDRVRGALAGMACGDAFGMPNSFLSSPPWRVAMVPGPPESPYHAGYPAGRITDDTEQGLALTDALEDGFSIEAVAKHLNEWFVSVGGEHSLAVGPSTKRAMMAYQAKAPVLEIGRTGVTNGAAMRIAPIGAFAGLQALSMDALIDLVERACLPTHHTTPAIAGAGAIAAAVAAAVQGQAWDVVMDQSVAGAREGARRGAWIYSASVADRIVHARRLAATAGSDQELVKLVSDVIGAGEPTTESVPAALAIADYAGGDPARAIEISGNLRGDTDTIAAMAGAVCGAYAGIGALPKAWVHVVSEVNQLDVAAWSDRLERCARQTVLAAV